MTKKKVTIFEILFEAHFCPQCESFGTVRDLYYPDTKERLIRCVNCDYSTDTGKDQLMAFCQHQIELDKYIKTRLKNVSRETIQGGLQ